VLNKALETRLAGEYVRKLNIRTSSVFAAMSQLSGGNQQKTLLGRALLSQPKILLLDEPTKGIDVGAKAEIYKLMEELSQQGMAVVAISSELPELLAMCDRFIVLARGKVMDEFTRADASEHRAMLAATGTRRQAAS
jgi:ABC-type sugar transport system ATPase subunit